MTVEERQDAPNDYEAQFSQGPLACRAARTNTSFAPTSASAFNAGSYAARSGRSVMARTRSMSRFPPVKR